MESWRKFIESVKGIQCLLIKRRYLILNLTPENKQCCHQSYRKFDIKKTKQGFRLVL